MRLLKFLLVLIILLPILAIGALFIAPPYIDWNAQKHRVESFLSSKTKYDISLGGELSFKMLPNPYIHMDEIKVAAFHGDKPLFQARNLNLELDLKKLFYLNVGVKKLSMDNPEVYLMVTEQGQANWQPKRIKRRSSGGQFTGLGPVDSIGDVVISDAQLTYENDQTGQRYMVTDAQFGIGGRDLRKAALNLSANINEVPVEGEFATNLTNLVAMPLTGNLKIGDSQLDVDGRISTPTTNPAYIGQLSIDGPDLLPALYRIINLPPEQGAYTYPVTFEGKVNLAANQADLDDFTATIGAGQEVVLGGTLNWQASQKDVPARLEGNLKAEKPLQLNALGLCEADKSDASTPAAQPQNGDSFWPTDKVDVSALQAMDIDVSLVLAGLVCGKRTFDEITANIENQNNRLNITNTRVRMGQGSLGITLAADLQPAVDGALNLIFNDLPVHDVASPGTGAYELPLNGSTSVSFKGDSVADWMQSLNGNVDVKSQQVILHGYTLDNLLGIARAFVLGKNDKAEDGKEDEGNLEAVFTIEDGIMRTERFALRGEGMGINGSGKIDLGRGTINYRLKAEGGNTRLGVPILIKGSLERPLVVPDVVSIEGIGTGIGGAIGGPAGAAVGNMIGGMISGDGQATPSKDPSPTEPPLDLLTPDGLEDRVKNFLRGEGKPKQE